MQYIQRAIHEPFENSFGSGKILILYGPRQVGKTTFVRSFLDERPRSRYFQCEQSQVRDILSSCDLPRIMQMLGDTDFVVFDEAQVVENVGTALKILHDAHPKIQIIVTGSSSFDIQNRIIEPLTGRHRDFMLFPFSYEELRNEYGARFIERYSFEDRILYGTYPEAINPTPWESARDVVTRIAEDYALKDILAFSWIRKSETLIRLLKALAYQIGQEVSYASIAKDFGMSLQTIESYVEILEKAFIVFRLPPYSGNKRSGIKKMRKIYFWDIGIRNALIESFMPVDIRNDKGALFENFFIAEYAKKIRTHNTHESLSFWRSYNGAEIDLIVEKDGQIRGYDMKWQYAKPLIITSESAPIPNATPITRTNFMEHL